MTQDISSPENLSRQDTARLIIDFFHRTMIHHAMWLAELWRQLGREKAMDILNEVYDRSFQVQMNRLAKILGLEMKDGLPQPLLDLPEETLLALKEGVAANWLANDGIWFQAVEFSRGMFDAKRCNDSCWARFSPFEAWSIKRFLDLPDRPGLEGLKEALKFRLYTGINHQSVTEETDNSFVFQMNDCRVQTARKRKGLDDYPCKSGGMAEYPSFAESIDPRIKTECLGCPPDDHPAEWYCAWRFFLEEE
ncbi:MAG: cytosolic protein [Deltaproteobacteria bacterium]|nr:cytosolic protein [Deltaproteobacteria bacterium]